MTESSFISASEIEGVVVRKPSRHDDSRGWLVEFFRDDEIEPVHRPAMGYLSVTKPGNSRGPHEHIDQSDCFFFPGPGEHLLVLWDNRKESPTYRHRMVFSAGGEIPLVVIVPPRVVHAYCCVSQKPGEVINIPNRLYRGEGRSSAVDEVRHEDDPESPFTVDFKRLIAERAGEGEKR
ncbi:MAG: dTDP-4-dehydrorhamnose 3,5-epimerase family protein [Pseudomonadota bacterium]